MTAPTEIIEWASGTPSGTVIGSLNINNITYHLNGEVDYTFSSTPDLSAVNAGHMLEVTGAANASNNGRFTITQVDDAGDRLRVLNMARYSTTSTDDETGSLGTGTVVNDGPILADIPIEKQEQGYFDNEYPSAAHFNKLFQNITQWIKYFATGGAVVFRATLTAWKAITRTSEGGENIHNGGGFIRFDETATEAAGEGFYAQTSGAGIGILELASPDMIWSLLSNDINESLQPVIEAIDFGSISATSSGSATVNVPGARSTDQVLIGVPAALSASLFYWGKVTADDVVTIYLYNPTGGAIDPASGDFSVTVYKPNRLPGLSLRALKLYLNIMGGAYASGTALDTDLALGDNEAAMWLLLANRQYRENILADAAAVAIFQASTDADAIMTAYEGAY